MINKDRTAALDSAAEELQVREVVEWCADRMAQIAATLAFDQLVVTPDLDLTAAAESFFKEVIDTLHRDGRTALAGCLAEP